MIAALERRMDISDRERSSLIILVQQNTLITAQSAKDIKGVKEDTAELVEVFKAGKIANRVFVAFMKWTAAIGGGTGALVVLYHFITGTPK